MDFLKEAEALANMAVPGPGTPDEAKQLFDAMPVAELASTWCAIERVSLRDMTAGTWMAKSYLDRLPHEEPERAFDLILAILRSESDKLVVMQLNNRMMTGLLYAHGSRMIERIEAEARANPRLRWLIGGIQWWGSDQALLARLKPIADIDGWEADREARDTPAERIRLRVVGRRGPCARLGRADLKARKGSRRKLACALRLRIRVEGERSRPDNRFDSGDPKIETNPMLLSVLSAGPLEDIVSGETIDRIEREAAADPRFRDLLAGVWYTSKPASLQARLDAILQRSR